MLQEPGGPRCCPPLPSANRRRNIMGWDEAYDNLAHVPGSAALPEVWARRARAFRAAWPGADLDVAYGTASRQRLDLFHPSGSPKGLAAFVHGGYWMRFDKSFWSDLAAGPLAAGWAVAMVGYSLAPQARIREIVREVGRAVEAAGERVAGPIRLAGHSAGGHLALRLACGAESLAGAATGRIDRVVSISGLHDLRPLLRTSMRQTLRLDPAEAAAESPVLLRPADGVAATAWVGGDELPEFLRQADALAEAWPNAKAHRDARRHHFDVIDGLRLPESPLTKTLLAPVAGRAPRS